MSIKPFDLTQKASEIPEELNEILRKSGLVTDIKEDEKESIDTARKVFNSAGADLQNVATTVSNIMLRGETDAGRLKAAELTLKVHGILNEIDDKSIPQITINIAGSENKTLINLVLPI